MMDAFMAWWPAYLTVAAIIAGFISYTEWWARRRVRCGICFAPVCRSDADYVVVDDSLLGRSSHWVCGPACAAALVARLAHEAPDAAVEVRIEEDSP